MEAIALAILTTAAAVWIGAIVFQSAIVAPVVFVNLDEASARVFLRTLFPRLFKLGLACGAIMAASLAYVGYASGWTTAITTIALAIVLMVVFGAASLAMVRHINAAKDAGSAGVARFKQLHRANVSLTMLILLLGIFVLYLIAHRASLGL
ncbi:MAG: DUF4149 domain-containing protein [Gammaproteobacteria bacterium]